MSEKRIVIGGGGFAGVTAARELCRRRKYLNGYEIVLVNETPFFEFIPMLPDVLAGWLRAESVRVDLTDFCRRQGIEFRRGKIEEIDPQRRSVGIGQSSLAYEYLILATGSKTFFYGNEELRNSCERLDTVADALRIRERFKKEGMRRKHLNLVVVGGGYTGLEIVTNSHFLLSSIGVPVHITIVEKSNDLLAMVPGWLRKKAKRFLDRLHVDILTGETVNAYKDHTAYFESGKILENVCCVWAAGVSPEPLRGIPSETVRGRVKVNWFLQAEGTEGQGLYVAGDVAAFPAPDHRSPLRMAIMFAMGQGKRAACNIVRQVRGKKIKPYHPLDLGYLIPLTYARAPGIVLGIRVGNFPGFLLHYLLCIYRSFWRKKLPILSDIFQERLPKRGGREKK
ncbi:MAG: hypothetical protein GF333_02560 [Candidatus Omnitrophica bacterium]|nr:hypothetical protein [Candidatus Omnitrophota bacterium]